MVSQLHEVKGERTRTWRIVGWPAWWWSQRETDQKCAKSDFDGKITCIVIKSLASSK